MPFFLALLALPLIEIALFVQIGGAIGLWGTLAIVIASGILGVNLLRAEKYRAFSDVQSALSRNADAATPLAHGAMRMIAGILLIVPGFLTDIFGLLLLIPGLRSAALRRVIGNAVWVRASQKSNARRDDVIDGEYEVYEPERPINPHNNLPNPDQNRPVE
jgi:UPF0716 protein FxsA